jgi:hypothetical protein
MDLETKHIDDWNEFVAQNDIDIIGIEPLWPVIWNTGFHAVCVELPVKLPNVFAFEYDDYVWFGLTSCGQDNRPWLASAWATLFPDCDWVPDNFILTGIDLRGGYYATELGGKAAKKIYALIASTIEAKRRQLVFLEQDLREAKK